MFRFLRRVWPFSKFASPNPDESGPASNQSEPNSPPPDPSQVTNVRFPCPHCWRVMGLTVAELAEQRYECPICHAIGRLTEPPQTRPPSPTPPPPPPPDTSTTPSTNDTDASEQPEPIEDWTVCPACDVELKTKNLYTHQLLHCRPTEISREGSYTPSVSVGGNSHSNYPNYPTSRPDSTKPIPAYCTRCKERGISRWVEWPIYYNNLPYGSYCITKVRG